MFSNTVKVGLATLSGLVLLGYIIFFLNEGRSPIGEKKGYQFKVMFDDVKGLPKGSEVRLAGVKIGEVKDISLSNNGKAVVTVFITAKKKIKKNAIFSIELGLFQDKSLIIREPITKFSKFLKNGDILKERSIAPSSLDDLMLSAKDAAAQLNKLLASFNDIISNKQLKENILITTKNIVRTTDEAANFAESMKDVGITNKETINATIKNIHQLSQNFNEIADSVKTLVNNTNDIAGDEEIKNQIKTIVASLNTTMANMEEISQSLNDILSDGSVKRDIKSTIAETRDMISNSGLTVKGISKVVQSLNETEIHPSFEFRYHTDMKKYFADMNLKFLPPSRTVYYLLGLDDIGENSTTNLQLGVESGLQTWFRFGLRGGKLGIGYERVDGNYYYEGDLLDPNDLQFNTRVGKRLSPTLYFMLGAEDLFGNELLSFGLLQRY